MMFLKFFPQPYILKTLFVGYMFSTVLKIVLFRRELVSLKSEYIFEKKNWCYGCKIHNRCLLSTKSPVMIGKEIKNQKHFNDGM